MKYIITAFISFAFLSSFGQQMTYQQWKEEAANEINLQPEYGHVTKNKELIEIDNKFIESELKISGTHRKASEEQVKLGFDYLYRGDIKTAMRRFNQAWLLDPKNENAYWGYGAVYFTFNDYDEALKQLEKGLSINPSSSNILTDIATINVSFYMTKGNPDYLNKAIGLFIQSYKIDPHNQNTLFKLSAAYYYKNDCVNAWKYYNECMRLGGQQISPGYADALKKQCPN
jgi:tetratricopeptide (TPR) repeat protein